MTTATAHGKFILSGEHFVVDGAHSVVIPADCFYTTVELYEQPLPMLEVQCIFECGDAPQGKEIHPYESRVFDLVYKACKILDIDAGWMDGLGCKVITNIPPGQGAGSSSALCQAIIEALIHEYLYDEVHPNYLMWFGQQLENTFHGPVSGVDNAAIAYRKILCYQRTESPRPLINPLPLDFVVGSIGPRSPEIAPYEIIRNLKLKSPADYKKYLTETDKLSEQLAEAICSKQSNQARMGITENMFNSFKILYGLGLLPKEAKSAIQVALDNSIPSVRMTGAGGGGFLIAMVNGTEEKDFLMESWKKLGLKSVHSIHFDGQDTI